MPVRYLLPAVVLLVGACAAALPGYSPPPFKEKKTAKLVGPSGEMSSDGSYQLSDNEKERDCKRTLGSMQITIARLKDPLVRQEPSAMSSAAQKLSPLYGGGSSKGGDRQAIYARERAKLEAYNAELAAKGCRTFDIEAELARPSEPPKKY